MLVPTKFYLQMFPMYHHKYARETIYISALSIGRDTVSGRLLLCRDALRLEDRRRGDPRDDHVDPRHDHRQRRHRDPGPGLPRPAVHGPVGVDRLPAGPRHDHPRHRVGGRAVRRQADVDHLARASSSLGSALSRCGVVHQSLIFFRDPPGHRRRHDHAGRAVDHGPVAGPQRMGRVMGVVSVPACSGRSSVR